MNEPSKAVFLSYASQDAPAVERIAEALRAAGVEVWFDKNELTGGDAWDQKIRKQIKECALFLPVISAATNSRREGYFRREWKLAVDRTHDMDEALPFLVPVVIDGTTDAGAFVPEKFREVQWTRLPGGETPEKFCARVNALLRGDSAPARPRAAAKPAPATDAPPPRAEKNPPWLKALVVTLALGAFVLVAWWGLRNSPDAPALASAEKKSAPVAPAAAAPEFPRDPELRRAVAMLNGTEANSEDFALAEDIAKKALAKNSTDPEAVTVMARVQVSYLYRGFDRSDDRRATARRYAERAVQLAPNDPDAIAALGVFHFQQSSNSELARELLNKAIQLRPDEPYYYRHRDNALFGDPRVPVAEALASAEKTAERFPRDALAHYELARHYRDLGRMDEAERAIDRTLAIEPIANAIAWKARFALNLRSDFAETKALLDRIPPRMRALERVVISRWIYAISGTDREDGIEALQTLTNSWIEDFYYVGPKSLLMAALLEASGKRETARLNYDAALTETRTRQAREPGNLRLQNVETSALLGLGRLDEARAANRVVMESVRRPYRYDPFETWWFSEIPRCLLLGERETALQLLREAAVGEAATPSGRIATWSSHIGVSTILRTAMKQDPRMAPFRDDPEIVALLAEPKKETADAPLSEAAQLAARAKAMFIKFAYTREDLASAEELARRATEKEPDNAAAWGVRAAVNGTYLQRNWDLSEKRLQETQNAANRALGLNPDEVEGLWARGYVFYRQGAYAQAEENLRRAVALAPTNNRMGRALAIVIGAQPGREEESRQILLDVVKRDPRDSLVRYELAGTYLSFGGGGDNPDILANALLHLDAGIAAQPLGSLLLLKAVLLGGWRGDFAGMRASLDELEKRPLAERTEDRAVYLAMWTSLLEHNVPRFNAAANLTAKNYFEDSVVPRRPKDWSLALAHRVEGKENLARLDWQRAETAVRERLRSDPNNQLLTYELATTLAWLGRNEEAARLIEPIEAAWREEPTRPRNRNLASFYAALGDAAKAAPYLNAGLDGGVFFTRKVVPLDPWFDKIRGAPEFAAAIKEKPAPKK